MFTAHRRGAALIVGALAVVGTLSACTTGLEVAESSDGPIELETVTFVNPLPDFPAWKVIGQCMADEAEAQGIDFTQSGPTGGAVDTQFMIDRFQQAIATKQTAIVTFPVSADQFDPVFKEATDAGILVATVEGGQTKNHTVNIGTSFEEFGALAAETVAQKGPGQVVGFLSEGPTGAPQQFVDAFTKYVTDNPDLGITIADTRYDGGDPTKSQDLLVAMLTAHPEINMIVTNEGTATIPAIAAIDQKGLKGKVFITTNSIYAGSLEGMENGYVYSFLLQDMCGIGTETIDALVKVAAGDDLKNVDTRIEFATKETVEELTADGTLQ